MTPEHQRLLTVLAKFVTEASERAPELAGLADREAADAMATWPIAHGVRQAAAAAAYANGYLDQSADDPRVTRPAGRPFSAQALHRLGIAGLLRSGHQVDSETLVQQVASYLAGPPIQLWRHFVLDIEWSLPAPVEIAEWRLWQPNSHDWDALHPVPAAADYAAEPVFDPLLKFGEHVVLSIPDAEAQAVAGHRIWWFSERATVPSSAWEQFLLLNLAHDLPVSAVAEYVVEPQRSVDRVHASIPQKYVGPDGGQEVPLLGPLCLDDSMSSQMIRFLEVLSSALQKWDSIASSSSKNQRKPYDRLRRSAARFLETGDKVGLDADVFFEEDRPQVAFNYVSALENLLSTEGPIDLRRRTAQRAAILLGDNDEQRLTIYDQVFDAYDVRNKIAHGDEPDPAKLTAATRLRRIFRRALIVAIVLGPEQELGTLCDKALLSHAVLREEIQAPLERFRSATKPA